MNGVSWIFSAVFFLLYICLLFTVCLLTFRKGHILLGVIGIFFPILWLVGAILPAKRGSRYDVEQGMRYQAQIEQMTK
jgi:hypothetical protein